MTALIVKAGTIVASHASNRTFLACAGGVAVSLATVVAAVAGDNLLELVGLDLGSKANIPTLASVAAVPSTAELPAANDSASGSGMTDTRLLASQWAEARAIQQYAYQARQQAGMWEHAITPSGNGWSSAAQFREADAVAAAAAHAAAAGPLPIALADSRWSGEGLVATSIAAFEAGLHKAIAATAGSAPAAAAVTAAIVEPFEDVASLGSIQSNDGTDLAYDVILDAGPGPNADFGAWTSMVPEPGSLLTLAAAGVMTLSRRRRLA